MWAACPAELPTASISQYFIEFLFLNYINYISFCVEILYLVEMRPVVLT